jgi:hypothetical protein
MIHRITNAGIIVEKMNLAGLPSSFSQIGTLPVANLLNPSKLRVDAQQTSLTVWETTEYG